MDKREASLIARMEVALVGEGILWDTGLISDHKELAARMALDKELILEAVRVSWPDLDVNQRRSLRRWAPEVT